VAHLENEHAKRGQTLASVQATLEEKVTLIEDMHTKLSESEARVVSLNTALNVEQVETRRLKDVVLENSSEKAVNAEMVEKIVDAMNGAGYPVVGGWGDDEQLTRLETQFERVKGYIESASGETEEALSYLDNLGAILDEIRTER
jgi:hypothetical protein